MTYSPIVRALVLSLLTSTLLASIAFAQEMNGIGGTFLSSVSSKNAQQKYKT